MQYMGSKNRISKQIGEYLTSVRDDRVFVEPFCGSCSITAIMGGQRIACDLNPDLILLWKAVQDGWLPPETVTEDEYKKLKHKPSSALRGFAGFACSFGGKWFGGYARKKEEYNFARAARNSIIAIAPKLKDVLFQCADYTNIRPTGSLVYCDPPYENTTSYAGSGKFDSTKFWDTMRRWSADNLVLVSSYEGPKDFVSVWEKEAPTTLAGGLNGAQRVRKIERLFKLR